MQRGVSEKVAEILKELQQLVGGVLEDGEHLGGHHVVDDEERRLSEKEGGMNEEEELRCTVTSAFLSHPFYHHVYFFCCSETYSTQNSKTGPLCSISGPPV